MERAGGRAGGQEACDALVSSGSRTGSACSWASTGLAVFGRREGGGESGSLLLLAVPSMSDTSSGSRVVLRVRSDRHQTPPTRE
eukprot:92808-Hanusia_phi.AAC.5